MAIKGTTIFAIRHKDKMAMAGDGQVTLGNQVVMKHSARKVRRLFDDKVVAGFAGSVADAFTLFEKFEANLYAYNGNLTRRPSSSPRNGGATRSSGSLRPC